MARIQHTLENSKDGPIYVSIEPWPECFELEPGDKLTIVYDAADPDTAMIHVQFINDRELVVWPDDYNIEFLLNGQPARDRSWKFKHR